MTLFCVYYRLMKEADVADLIDTTEMYLKTILELEEDGVTPLRARIVDRLGHSGPTVSQTVARMERDGLLVVRTPPRCCASIAWPSASSLT